MNYPEVISFFFRIANKDSRINTTHLGLYLALLECQNNQRSHNPFFISRSKLMSLSKIQSTSTYHKCIKELRESGVISYRPSYHPVKGTEIVLNCNA